MAPPLAYLMCNRLATLEYDPGRIACSVAPMKLTLDGSAFVSPLYTMWVLSEEAAWPVTHVRITLMIAPS